MWYNSIMSEIDELIEQAKEVLKNWKKPSYDDIPPSKAKSWKELLDNRGYDPKTVSYMAGQPKGL